MRCRGNSTYYLSQILSLLALSGIIQLGDTQEVIPFTLKDARNYYQVKLGVKQHQQQDEMYLGNHSNLTLDNSDLKAEEFKYTKELIPDSSQGNSFQPKKKYGSENNVTIDQTIHLKTKMVNNHSRKAAVRSKPSSVLTPKGRFRHYRVRPTSGSDLQELRVHKENRFRSSRRYRVRKNTGSTFESGEKHEHKEKQKYPRIRFQNQYRRPNDSVVQKGILVKSSQPLMNYTLPTLKPDAIQEKSYGLNKKANNQRERDQDTGSSSQHPINVSEKTSTRTRVPKDVRKDGVTSFTPIVHNKNGLPAKAIRPSLTASIPIHTSTTYSSKTAPRKGLTASLGNAASSIAALTQSAARTASLTKLPSSFASQPKVYIPPSKKSALPPVYVPVTTKAPIFKSIIPQIPVNSPVTASPLSPPVPDLNKGFKISVAPSVKHALSYERRFLKPSNSNIGSLPSSKNPLATPFNPYTTLFLPQYGGNNFGQLGPIHIPHQIPVLNLPLPSAGGYRF